MTILLLLAGLGLLVVGGELLVRGAVRIAERFGVSPLLIGLTLVGFGTSTPELVTSLEAALLGSPGIAIGNIVGSNIANVLLILGISALIRPIATEGAALRRDGALMVATALAMLALGLAVWPIGRGAGALFLLALVAYMVLAFLQERRSPEQGHGAAYEKGEAYGELHDGPLTPGHVAATPAGSVTMPVALALGGLAIVVLGGKLLVDAAIELARTWGVSETVIGLTIVAVGTSLPELVTSVVAAMRGHSAVALGNILGSNIYNILGIGGVVGLVSPTLIPAQIATFDNLVMVWASIAVLVAARTGATIARWEGALLVLGYLAYLVAIWPR